MGKNKAKRSVPKKSRAAAAAKTTTEKVVEKTKPGFYGSFTGMSAIAVAIAAAMIVRHQTAPAPLIETNKIKDQAEVQHNNVDSLLGNDVDVDANDNDKNFTIELGAKSAQQEASSYTEVSIATFHNVDDFSPQKEKLLRYLQYDDGYTACIEKKHVLPDTFGVWQLKQEKLKYLELIANLRDHWVLQISKDENTISPNMDRITSTCRILTLTHEDFDGVSKLREALHKFNIGDLFMHKQSSASEYRTYACMARAFEKLAKQDQLAMQQISEIRSAWFELATAAKQQAQEEPPLPLKRGWTLKKEKESSFYYYHKVGSTKSTWIRPTVKSPREGKIPAEEDKKSSLVVRGKPCDWELQLPLIA